MTATSTSLLHGDISEKILGSFFQVYGDLGYGFLESPYKNALAIELTSRGLTVSREVPVEIHYRGLPVGSYRFDLLVAQCVLVEVKANNALFEADERQLLNYLRATNIEVGLLLNFGPKPSYKRLVYSNARKPGVH